MGISKSVVVSMCFFVPEFPDEERYVRGSPYQPSNTRSKFHPTLNPKPT